MDTSDAPEAMLPVIERAREGLGPELAERLVGLPETTTRDDVLYCHASPGSDMLSFGPEAADEDAELLGVESRRVVFGHTHVQFARAGAGEIELVNPGSVGLPFDGDHRAGYALVHDDGRVELRRVEYDWRSALGPTREASGRASREAPRTSPVRRGSAQAAGWPAARVQGQCYRGARVRLSSVLAPRDREFFDLFEEAGGNILRAAGLLEEMLRDFPERNELAREILICEQEGDRITHDIIQRLNQTFVTPIDREDIHEIASALDDVVDYTEEVADYLGLYKIEAPMSQAQDLAKVLHAASRQIAEAMPRLRGFKDISHYTVEINRLENDGDRITREAIASLFDTGIDPMVVIRWKDIFERLEEAIDATERVANILEGIVIKNS